MIGRRIPTRQESPTRRGGCTGAVGRPKGWCGRGAGATNGPGAGGQSERRAGGLEGRATDGPGARGQSERRAGGLEGRATDGPGTGRQGRYARAPPLRPRFVPASAVAVPIQRAEAPGHLMAGRIAAGRIASGGFEPQGAHRLDGLRPFPLVGELPLRTAAGPARTRRAHGTTRATSWSWRAAVIPYEQHRSGTARDCPVSSSGGPRAAAARRNAVCSCGGIAYASGAGRRGRPAVDAAEAAEAAEARLPVACRCPSPDPAPPPLLRSCAPEARFRHGLASGRPEPTRGRLRGCPQGRRTIIRLVGPFGPGRVWPGP